MVSKHATSFCKWIIVTLILKLSLTLQTWPSLHVDRKCSWLGPSGGGSGYIVHVRGGDCFVPFHSSYWGKHFARLFVMPYFVVRLLSANTSFKRLPSWFRTVKCLFPENIHIPRRHFCFNDSIRCTCHGPSPLEFPWFSHLVGYPLERIFLSKKLMHYTSMPSPSSRILSPFGPLSPQNFLCPSLACMYIFWNYRILAIVSKPHASPILWRFRFSYHS